MSTLRREAAGELGHAYWSVLRHRLDGLPCLLCEVMQRPGVLRQDGEDLVCTECGVRLMLDVSFRAHPEELLSPELRQQFRDDHPVYTEEMDRQAAGEILDLVDRLKGRPS